MIIVGHLIVPLLKFKLKLLEDHALVIDDASGRIVACGPSAELDALAAAHGGRDGHAVTRLAPTQLLVPGFIDCHIHAPQYEFTGTGTDLQLFDWLNTYTFPTEQAFADPGHAQQVYTAVVRRLLSLGTTTAAYFATIHAGGTRVLADVVLREGQRALVGKVNMDQQSPDSYVEGTEAGVAAAADVAAYVAGLPSRGRLLPCLVPRFLPTCSDAMLRGLGRLAAERPGLRVHSHIAESRDEVQFSARCHEPGEGQGDAHIFDRTGLLTRGSIMAHGTQLTDAEMRLLAQRGTGIAHCPLSNMFFGDGLLDVRRAVALGVHVGLGSDIAGGYSPSMLVAQRMAVVNSHSHKSASLMAGAEDADGTRRAFELTWQDALWLATLGGAQALALDQLVGSLQVGQEFDALVLDAGGGQGFDLFARDGPWQMLEKVLNLGDDRHVAAVYVQGRRVGGSSAGGGGSPAG